MNSAAAIAMNDDAANRIRLVMKLRSAGIRDTRVLAAMENVPRERFVDDSFYNHAYDDTALPIACGQTISQPTMVAWMTEALDVKPRHTVLEVGTGSGYQAAVLSQLARRVYTIERHRSLLHQAEQRFETLGLNNIVTRLGDGCKGWREAAPFDRIMVTAAAGEVPMALTEQLRSPGIMIIPVGDSADCQALLRIVKDEHGELHEQTMMPVRFVPLVAG